MGFKCFLCKCCARDDEKITVTTYKYSSNDENKTSSKMSFNTPCEISDTVLMASSEDVCLALKEKISNHDHD